jgi:EAL domain-containing protein (putative c-di-GMP-specific phosphodiesterase class I)/FixJ family two-component response regulator
MNMKALRILVVEDQNFQRKMIVHMLRSLGAGEVRQASNGRQALEMMQAEHALPFHIVLCDLDMPEMDGMEFIRHLAKLYPATSAVVISGMDYAVIASVEKMARSYGIKLLGIIEKPTSLDQLEELLELHQHIEAKTLCPAAVVTSFTLGEILLALRAKQFEPFLQPKVEMETGSIVGAEALARWIHPVHGVIAPCAFIPLLERSGNMNDLTFMMLEKAAHARRMLGENGHPLVVSVNLSLSSLADTTLADSITRVVIDAGVDPRHIILEVTESAAMSSVAEALENLSRLRMRGFGLSIDDYGTGYSSMQQLARVPFTELKIDRSFVSDSTNDSSLRVIVKSSVDMARKLNVKSVAEGVENQEEWNMLKDMGCDVAQGYFIAKPMGAAAFLEFCTRYIPAESAW